MIEKNSPDKSFHYIHAIRVKFNHANKWSGNCNADLLREHLDSPGVRV